MATQTISLTGSTYISTANITANNSSAATLKTNTAAIKSLADGSQWPQTGNDALCAAILRFTRPAALTYKQINRVMLSFSVSFNFTGNNVPIYCSRIPYRSTAALSAINASNIYSQGTIGAQIVDFQTKNVTALSNLTYSVDITDIFAANLDSNIFNLVLGLASSAGSSGAAIGNITASTAQLVIDYVDVAPMAPTPLYPSGITIRENSSQLFSWQYNSASAATQASVTLEYKLTSAASYTVVSLTTTAYNYTLNTALAPGDYQWRLKITNNVGEATPYSAVAYFTIIGKPAQPVIADPANKTLTTISWSATGQESFDIVLKDGTGNELLYDSVVSGDTTYPINMFLKGNYSVGIRVKNASDQWSDWTYKTFAITASGPAAATLSLLGGETSMTLDYSVPNGVNAVAMRSDNGEAFKPIAVLEAGSTQYVDETIRSGVQHTYAIRTYVNGYTDSNTRTVTPEFSGIILQGDVGTVRMKTSEDKFMQHAESKSRDIAIIRYSGRELPGVEYNDYAEVSINKRAFVDEEQKKILDRMTTAFYRDSAGRAYMVALTKLSYSNYMNMGYMVDLEMARIHEEEVVINV